MTTIYRMQDRNGRGPWKPGFSKQWVDAGDHIPPPPWQVEFEADFMEAHERGLHIGSGCRTIEGLKKWFTIREKRRLWKLGYSVVALVVDEILGESKNQVLFARRKPLREVS